MRASTAISLATCAIQVNATTQQGTDGAIASNTCLKPALALLDAVESCDISTASRSVYNASESELVLKRRGSDDERDGIKGEAYNENYIVAPMWEDYAHNPSFGDWSTFSEAVPTPPPNCDASSPQPSTEVRRGLFGRLGRALSNAAKTSAEIVNCEDEPASSIPLFVGNYGVNYTPRTRNADKVAPRTLTEAAIKVGAEIQSEDQSQVSDVAQLWSAQNAFAEKDINEWLRDQSVSNKDIEEARKVTKARKRRSGMAIKIEENDGKGETQEEIKEEPVSSHDSTTIIMRSPDVSKYEDDIFYSTDELDILRGSSSKSTSTLRRPRHKEKYKPRRVSLLEQRRKKEREEREAALRVTTGGGGGGGGGRFTKAKIYNAFQRSSSTLPAKERGQVKADVMKGVASGFIFLKEKVSRAVAQYSSASDSDTASTRGCEHREEPQSRGENEQARFLKRSLQRQQRKEITQQRLHKRAPIDLCERESSSVQDVNAKRFKSEHRNTYHQDGRFSSNDEISIHKRALTSHVVAVEEFSRKNGRYAVAERYFQHKAHGSSGGKMARAYARYYDQPSMNAPTHKVRSNNFTPGGGHGGGHGGDHDGGNERENRPGQGDNRRGDVGQKVEEEVADADEHDLPSVPTVPVSSAELTDADLSRQLDNLRYTNEQRLKWLRDENDPNTIEVQKKIDEQERKHLREESDKWYEKMLKEEEKERALEEPMEDPPEVYLELERKKAGNGVGPIKDHKSPPGSPASLIGEVMPARFEFLTRPGETRQEAEKRYRDYLAGDKSRRLHLDQSFFGENLNDLNNDGALSHLSQHEMSERINANLIHRLSQLKRMPHIQSRLKQSVDTNQGESSQQAGKRYGDYLANDGLQRPQLDKYSGELPLSHTIEPYFPRPGISSNSGKSVTPQMEDELARELEKLGDSIPHPPTTSLQSKPRKVDLKHAEMEFRKYLLEHKIIPPKPIYTSAAVSQGEADRVYREHLVGQYGLPVEKSHQEVAAPTFVPLNRPAAQSSHDEYINNLFRGTNGHRRDY